jgi:pimeloyl-ACP methyl ester carboxylesterase
MVGVGELPNDAPRDPGEIAQYLCGAYKTGVEIDFHRVDRKLWGLALDWLIDRSMLDVAMFAAPRLALAYPETRFLQTIAAIFARLPPPCDHASFAAFRDDVTREVQIIPRTGASAALLGFCGRAQRMGMPLNLIHRWFGQLGVHVIYLRDYQGKNYDNGIRSLAPDLGGTLQALREVIASLGVQRVVCYGNSLGGYGALRYALELQSEAVLCFAGPTSLVPGVDNILLREQRGVVPGLNLRPLYQRASCAPRTHLVYSEHHAFDRAQASNFAGLPTVSLEMAHGASGHDVLLHVLFHGRYERLIRWLVDPHRVAGAP